MVHPQVGSGRCREQVVAADIYGTRSFEPQVADDDVVASRQSQQSRVSEFFFRIVQVVYKELSDAEFHLLAHGKSVAERSSVALSAAFLHLRGIEFLLDVFGHLEGRPQGGSVDADKRFVLLFRQRYRLVEGERSVTAVENYDVVTFQGLDDSRSHIAAVAHERYRLTAFASAEVEAASVETGACGPSEGLAQVVFVLGLCVNGQHVGEHDHQGCCHYLKFVS